MRLKQNQNDLTRLLKYSFAFVFLINENDSCWNPWWPWRHNFANIVYLLSQIVKAIKFDNKYLLTWSDTYLFEEEYNNKILVPGFARFVISMNI